MGKWVTSDDLVLYVALEVHPSPVRAGGEERLRDTLYKKGYGILLQIFEPRNNRLSQGAFLSHTYIEIHCW